MAEDAEQQSEEFTVLLMQHSGMLSLAGALWEGAIPLTFQRTDWYHQSIFYFITIRETEFPKLLK